MRNSLDLEELKNIVDKALQAGLIPPENTAELLRLYQELEQFPQRELSLEERRKQSDILQRIHQLVFIPKKKKQSRLKRYLLKQLPLLLMVSVVLLMILMGMGMAQR